MMSERPAAAPPSPFDRMVAASTRATEALTRRSQLDGPAAALRQLTADRTGQVISVARGRGLGHPLHPAFTDLPIGFWTSALVLDLLGGHGAARSARLLVGCGVVSAVPTILTGVAEVPKLRRETARVAVVHAAANGLATAGYSWSWLLRRRATRTAGALSGLLAGALATAGGVLGGWLANPRPDRNQSTRPDNHSHDERT